ncbi:ATP-binding protein [Caulobacter sp. 17J65-9]|uniref:ATP-binding protein n=1 Tax=Caulobacter sp. 17J65-9 TaxID=2709382 RepID=UPI0013CC69BF|nr:ATP-binding protein [Caulobacter sp. 17J65-9]NEX91758.1 response regulator [Caulobacter sp. 17J65-9]
MAKLSLDHGVAVDHNLEGEQSLAAYRHSPFTGWTFLVAVPMREVTGTFARSLLIAGTVTLGLLAVGVALAVHMARGMTNAVEALAHSASALGHGGPVMPVVTGMRETDAVAEALHASSVKLATREEELRRLNETLEERVAQRSHELSEAAASLVHARKAEAIGRLTGGTAHDFNNLLMAVTGNLDLLNKRLGDDDLRKYVDRARQAAERGSKLTAQLLAFARRQRLTVEPMDMSAMIDGMQALLDRSLGGAFRVEIRHPAHPAWALGDHSQLELVVLNLALNARDAMPQGGTIEIEIGGARVETAPETPEAPPAGDYVTLSVADAGTGMAPDVLAQMWEPFFTTKGPSAGSGLGLSQVLGVIKQLGGGARVETAPGNGTRVTIYVPVAAPAEAEAPEPAADLRPADLRGVRVLLVDDDAEVRRTTAALLTDLGCTPEPVDSGPAALARLAEGDLPQLVVMDYAMPGMTGSEAARRIAERWPSLPILLVTGYMEGEALEHAWHGPVLGKPFTEAQLAKQVAELLRSRA